MYHSFVAERIPKGMCLSLDLTAWSPQQKWALLSTDHLWILEIGCEDWLSSSPLCLEVAAHCTMRITLFGVVSPKRLIKLKAHPNFINTSGLRTSRKHTWTLSLTKVWLTAIEIELLTWQVPYPPVSVKLVWDQDCHCVPGCLGWTVCQ